MKKKWVWIIAVVLLIAAIGVAWLVLVRQKGIGTGMEEGRIESKISEARTYEAQRTQVNLASLSFAKQCAH